MHDPRALPLAALGPAVPADGCTLQWALSELPPPIAQRLEDQERALLACYDAIEWGLEGPNGQETDPWEQCWEKNGERVDAAGSGTEGALLRVRPNVAKHADEKSREGAFHGRLTDAFGMCSQGATGCTSRWPEASRALQHGALRRTAGTARARAAPERLRQSRVK